MGVSGLGTSELMLLAVIFATVVSLVMAIAMLTQKRAAVGRKGDAPSVRFAQPEGPFAAILTRIGSKAAEGEKASDRTHIRRQLVRAGFRNPGAVYLYYATRIALAVALPLLASGFSYLVVGNLSARDFMLMLFGAAGLGLYLPSLWLSRRVEHRRTQIQQSFPDALDMLLVCVEAGGSLAASLQRVAQEVGRSHPVLADELSLVSAGLSAGQTREDALRQLAERAGTDDVSAFATIMIQSEMFGTSIADTLRVQASEMRKRRMLRAEEMANKLPVKITFPLALMIFPVLLIVIMTPLLLRISTALSIK